MKVRVKRLNGCSGTVEVLDDAGHKHVGRFAPGACGWRVYNLGVSSDSGVLLRAIRAWDGIVPEFDLSARTGFLVYAVSRVVGEAVEHLVTRSGKLANPGEPAEPLGPNELPAVLRQLTECPMPWTEFRLVKAD